MQVSVNLHLNIKSSFSLAGRSIAFCCKAKRGKSGQHRAPYFLTGRYCNSNEAITESATENNRPPAGG